MTRLLVSVRSVAEAEIAVGEGVDLVDVKEPARGSLGAADAATISAVVECVAGRVDLSAALGELSEGRRLPSSLAGKLRYAKFGLAGCAARGDWTSEWRRAIGRLPPGTAPVAVAYADWPAAGAPDPTSVLASAQSLGCAAVLLDTYDKSRGSLLDSMNPDALQAFIAAARACRLACVVAGSLGRREIERVLPLSPDYVAVRGAVCAGGRGGRLERSRVGHLVEMLRQSTTRQGGQRTDPAVAR